jgi:arginyl-tRNA--protein-N-Asp/Glu arginylyltransferase
MNSRQIQLYLTAESPCGYFDDRMSRNLVPDPKLQLTMSTYSLLIKHGFRRSGAYCYRPYCKACLAEDGLACIACRLPADEFISSRSQKRCLMKNQDLKLTVVEAGFNDEYFDLYRRYINSRHTDGSMANPDEEDFEQFLYCKWSHTQFLEFRLNERLVAVAVTDIVDHGISAVYSFFEPEMSSRSLGTFCILKQIDYAKKLGLDYLYLGYWIENHPKMHYKSSFKPLQVYLNEQWKTTENT